MTEETRNLANQVSNIAATMCQAKAVLDLVGGYGDLEPHLGSAVYGAATIVQAAIDALNEIEADARQAGAAA